MSDTVDEKVEKKTIAKKPAVKKTVAKKSVAKKAVKTTPKANALVKKVTTKKSPAPKAKRVVSKKALVAKPTLEKKTRIPRKPRGAKGFGEMLKKQSELEAAKKKVKTELRKEYDKALKSAEGIKEHYKSLFDESIESSKPKRGVKGSRTGTARKGAVAPITKVEVASFIEQREQGIAIENIKISGRRPKSIKRIAEAYSKAKVKDVDSVLASL